MIGNATVAGCRRLVVFHRLDNNGCLWCCTIVNLHYIQEDLGLEATHIVKKEW